MVELMLVSRSGSPVGPSRLALDCVDWPSYDRVLSIVIWHHGFRKLGLDDPGPIAKLRDRPKITENEDIPKLRNSIFDHKSHSLGFRNDCLRSRCHALPSDGKIKEIFAGTHFFINKVDQRRRLRDKVVEM